MQPGYSVTTQCNSNREKLAVTLSPNAHDPLLTPPLSEYPKPEVIRARLKKAAAVCGLLALACLPLSAAYDLYYYLGPDLRRFLPDVSPAASELALGLLYAALLMTGWAVLLLGLTRVNSRRLYERMKAQEDRLTPLMWGALTVVLSFSYAAIRIATNEPSHQATFQDLTSGEAWVPFQYRALVPIIVRSTLAVFPDLDLLGVYAIIDGLSAVAVVASFALFLSLFIEGTRTRRLLSLAVFFPLFLNLALPYRYNALFFPWDTPSVAFFTLGLYLIHTKRWTVFYPLFALATLNRETTCFLTICYALAYLGSDGFLKVSKHVVAQGAIWIAVKGALYAAFADNPLLNPKGSALFFNQIERSVGIVTSPVGLLYLMLTLGGTWVVVLLLHRFIQDPLLRRSFRFVPVFLIGMFFVGEMMEIRIYSELIPLVTAALLLVVRYVLHSLPGEAKAVIPARVEPPSVLAQTS